MPLYPSLKTFKVFVNLKKTFDTIDHKILIGKLEHYGVRSIAKDWLCSYLVNRKQFVSLNKNNSTIQTISTVVPQASFLGHLLFLIYINDLHICTKYSKPYDFADKANIWLYVLCHVTYMFQSGPTLFSCLNVKELLAQSRCRIWSLGDCNWTWTHNHLVHKRTLNHLAKLGPVWLNGWVLLYELSGCGFEYSCSHWYKHASFWYISHLGK